MKNAREASPIKIGPSPPKRFSPEKRAAEHHVVSTLTVKLGSTESKTSGSNLAVVPGKSESAPVAVSPVKQTGSTQVTMTKVSVKPSSPVKSSPVK